MKRIAVITTLTFCTLLSFGQKQLRLLDATMDITNAIVGTDKTFAGEQLPQAFRGEGVMIGVTDIGFDFTHPNFADSRFVAFWDFLSRDTIDSGLIAGRAYDGETMRNEVLRSYDAEEQTHGTHVLGIAAGGDETYRGIAPEADIAIIGNLLSNNFELMDSAALERLDDFYEFEEFRWFFEQAEKRGQPCVVNMSAGSTQTFGEDFDKWNRVMSELCGPGRIIVASAGNNGMKYMTLRKPAGQDYAGCNIYPNPKRAKLFLQSSGRVGLTFYASTNQGKTITALPKIFPTDASLQEDSTLTCPFNYNGTDFEIVVKEMVSDYDGRAVYLMELPDSLKENIKASIYVSLDGADSDAVLFTRNAQFVNKSGGFDYADNSYGVIFPASYDDVICVGGTTYRNEVTNKDGEIDSYYNGELGNAMIYSSVGPRIDGYQKPDCVAPGSFLISSYSSFYTETHPDAKDLHGTVVTTEQDGRPYYWVPNSGTSMSSPVVAGIIALWLQANPRLTPNDIKGVLSRTSRHPDPTLTYPNTIYGYGEIDAYAGLLDIIGLSNIPEISSTQPRNILFKVRGKVLEMEFTQASVGPVSVSVFSTNGVKLLTETFSSPNAKENIDLSRLPSGVYAIQVVSANNALNGSTLVRTN